MEGGGPIPGMGGCPKPGGGGGGKPAPGYICMLGGGGGIIPGIPGMPMGGTPGIPGWPIIGFIIAIPIGGPPIGGAIPGMIVCCGVKPGGGGG